MENNILKVVVCTMLIFSLCTYSGTGTLKIKAAKVQTPKVTAAVKATSKQVTYHIKKKTYKKGKIKLEYPKISDLKNSKLEKNCNTIIEKNTIGTLKNYTKDDSYEVTYETATQTKNMISIVLRYVILISGGKTEHDIVTLNVDLTKKKIVRLPEIVDVNALADKIISKTGYEVVDCNGAPAKEKVNDGYDKNAFIDSALGDADLQDSNKIKELKKELIKELKNCDRDSQLGQLHHSYYKDGKLHVSMVIADVAGSYCEFVFSKYKKNTTSN